MKAWLKSLFVSAMLVATSAFAAPTTTIVSLDRTGIPASGYDPVISSDGKFIAFVSNSNQFNDSDTNGRADVYVHERRTGLTKLVNISSWGKIGERGSVNPAISADGRFVAFTSSSANLVPGDTNGGVDVFVRDRLTGTTERASVTSPGEQANFGSHTPDISADGRYVVFQSWEHLVTPDTNGASDIFLYDRDTRVTERVSNNVAGEEGNGHSLNPAVSANGRFVAFSSQASNLVADDTNGSEDIFVCDRLAGSIERVSLSSYGAQANGDSYGSLDISPDGRFVVFSTNATNLVSEYSRGIVVHDRVTRRSELVSVSSMGIPADSYSGNPVISADGRYVSFWSSADKLVEGVPHQGYEAYIRDRIAGITALLSISDDGTYSDDRSGYNHTFGISADGRFTVFTSEAGSLVEGAIKDTPNIHLRDTEIGTGLPGVFLWTLSPGDVNGNGSADVLVTDGSGASEVKEADGSPIVRFRPETLGQTLGAVLVPDLTGDGIAELATLNRTLEGDVEVSLHDITTGSALPSIGIDPEAEPKLITVLDDVSGNGMAELAVLGVDRESGSVRAQVIDAVSGELLQSVEFKKSFTPTKLIAVPDLNGNGSQELALLGHEEWTGQTKVEVRDAQQGTWLRDIWFGGEVFKPLDVVLLEDINGNGASELAILGRHVDNGNLKAAIKDLDTGLWINTAWFAKTYSPLQMLVVPDLDGNSVSEIGLLGVDDATQQARVQLRDSRSGAALPIVWVDEAKTPVSAAVLPDTNGNGIADLAVLGEVGEKLRLVIKDSMTDEWLQWIEFNP